MALSAYTLTLKRYLVNLPGFRTNRKLIVIESDDWGSIRMPSAGAYQNLAQAGIPVEKNHYTRFDSIESDADLSGLFEVLSAFRDKNGRNPVITALCVVANPDFDNIRASGFEQYSYRTLNETLTEFPQSRNILRYWNEGAEKRLFVPEFHGREHLNVQRWLRSLRDKNPHALLAFNNGLWGISSPLIAKSFQAAFDPDYPEDIAYMHTVITEGAGLFKAITGYAPAYFVPPNGRFNLELNATLSEKGFRFITLEKFQREPLGNNKFRRHIRFLGSRSREGLVYLSRNASFEPSDTNHTDWVSKCLTEVAFAFKMHKPAVISTHRVNYAGSLDAGNRDRGLAQLTLLLKSILAQWPDAEFITSTELGDMVKNHR